MKHCLHKVKGVLPALIVPFNENMHVDDGALKEHVEFLIQEGVGGFYLNGSTGEGFLASDEERMHILEVVLDQVDGRLPVINHIGTLNMDSAIKLAKHSEEKGACAISSVPPFYYKFRPEEIKDYYYTIAGVCNIPFVIYDIYGNTGVNMGVDFIEEMAKNPLIAGIKFTSTNHYDMMKIKEINDGRFVVFSGCDEMCLSGLIAGADALIGSFYNILPKLYTRLFECFENNLIDEARRLYAIGNDVIRVFLKYPLYSALKVSLKWKGINGGICKKPFRQLNNSEKEALIMELKKIEVKRNIKLELFDENSVY